MHSVGLFVIILGTLGSAWTPQPARSFATTSMRAWKAVAMMPQQAAPPSASTYP